MPQWLFLELLTALLEYLDLFVGIVQSADFLAIKASLSPQNASIILDSCYARNYAGIIASSLIVAHEVPLMCQLL